MTINLPYFLLALALLWLPRSWLRRGPTLWRSRRRRGAHSWTHAPASGATLTFRIEFAKGRNYVDLLRAFVGTALLVGACGMTAAIGAAADASAEDRNRVLGIQVATLLVGLLIQTVRRERGRLCLAAPIFYVAGLTLGSPVPLAGLGGFTLAWAFVPIVPFTVGFLIVDGLVYGALGLFLGGVNLIAVAGAALCLVPVVVSLLTRRPLVLYSRRPASTRSEVAM